MTKNSNTGGEPTPGPGGEGDPDGHPVCQVVDPVAQDDHPGHAGDVAGGRVEVGVGVAVAVVLNLNTKIVQKHRRRHQDKTYFML